MARHQNNQRDTLAPRSDKRRRKMAKRLYPPLINYSMPAFDKDNEEGVNIYFALSSFNIRTEIKQAHATVRYQSSNANALSSVYPAKIKIC